MLETSILCWTKKNHFSFGRLETDEDTFVSSCGLLERKPLVGLAESVESCKHFYDSLGSDDKKNITLCLSGGIDSQCMAIAFSIAKIPFRAVFLRFKNELNAFDIKTNVDWCQQNQIIYDFIDLDIIDFFETGKYYDVAKRYFCQSPQIAAHLWMLDNIDGVPCLAGNPIAPIWRNNGWFFVGLPGELHSTYFKYFSICERPGLPWFFLYSPELIASFLKPQCMQVFVEKKVNNTSDYTYLVKCNQYASSDFLVYPRESKFTGFELVRKYYDEKYNNSHGQQFDLMYRKPLQELFPAPKNYYQLVPADYLNI